MRFAILFSVLAAVGCGSGMPATYPVTGTVTYQNKPVEGANVMFMPADGRSASGTTDAAGKFTLTTFEPNDGAIVGKHKISVAKSVKDPMADPNDPYAMTKNVLPAKYANALESPLEKEVAAKKEGNDFALELVD